MQPVVDMQRPVATEQGPDIAAFSVVRLARGQMPEGRMQLLQHRSETAVWQPRWLGHPNTAYALAGLTIVVADVDEAAGRFERLLGRAAEGGADGARAFELDRGRIELMTAATFASRFPGVPIPAVPYLGVVSCWSARWRLPKPSCEPADCSRSVRRGATRAVPARARLRRMGGPGSKRLSQGRARRAIIASS